MLEYAESNSTYLLWGRKMKLNGWQRLWMLVSAPFVILGAVVLYWGVVNENPIDLWAGFSMTLIGPLAVYIIGWGVAWVRRGFRNG